MLRPLRRMLHPLRRMLSVCQGGLAMGDRDPAGHDHHRVEMWMIASRGGISRCKGWRRGR